MNYDEFIRQTGITPDKQQSEAIRRVTGATLVLAVPGSGKTTTVITRAGYMVKVKKINPASILIITYTRSATAAMKARYEELFGASDGIEFRTIHGLCAKILQLFESKTGRSVFRVAENVELKTILRQITDEICDGRLSETEMGDLQSLITYHMNMLSSDDAINACTEFDRRFPDIYRRYADEKKRLKIMDHDDQLFYAYKILCSYPAIAAQLKKRYRYVSVDEAQDTSMLQHMIIGKIVDKNIFMVGDEDQSIYGFRAAYPEALLKFCETYPEGKIIKLETNYRSTPRIVEFAGKFISRNSARYEKAMTAAKKLPLGEAPKLIELHDFSSVYPYCLSVAQREDEETAFLYRVTDSVIPLVDLLEKNGIAYNLLGSEAYSVKTRFTARLSDLFSFVMNPYDEALFESCCFFMNAGISRKYAETAVQLHRRYPEKSFFQICGENELCKKAYRPKMRVLHDDAKKACSLSSFDFLLYLNNTFFSGQLTAAETSVDHHKFNVLLSLARENPDKKAFLDRISALSEIMQSGRNNSESKITLSTIHSAKGLEFDRTVLIDVKTGLLPVSSPDAVLSQDENNELEEERRLFYVASTRAKRELIVFTADAENGSPVTRSRFIGEAFYPDDTRREKENRRYALRSTTPIIRRNGNKVPSVPKRSISDEEQQFIRSNLHRGTVITHAALGDAFIISVTDRAIRVKLKKDGRIVPLDIDTIVKCGYITIKKAPED